MGREEIEDIDGRFLEEPDRGESPYVGLITKEVRRLERKAGMTEVQVAVFDAWLVLGQTTGEIAAVLGISPRAVRKDLAAAIAKADHCRDPHLGLLTVLVETFGWRAVRDAFFRA